jgi:hypothetical protein
VSSRAIVRLDSAFEFVLAMVLVVGVAAGRLGTDDFPAPVGNVVVLVFGCALLPVGALLWGLSLRPVPPRLLRTLAIANLTTAAAGLAWYFAATGFSTVGTALTISTAVALTILAAAQTGFSSSPL